MKNLLKLLGITIIVAMVMVSCETDPGTGGGGDPTVGPDINASTTAGILTPGETFQVSISATAGDGEMNTLTILENGVQVDPARIIEITGLAAVNNPALLFDGDRASFSYDVTMAASTQVGDQTISFKVDDDNNRSASADVFITVNADPASITYNGNTTITGIAPGGLVSIDLDVTKGTFPMNTIAVYEDGELISDPSRMELLGNFFDANPYTLTGDLKDAIDGMLLLRVHSEAAAKTYRIEITDESGETSSVDIDIIAGTMLTELQGVLFNAGGGQGTGGLDLDEGNSTNSDDPTAEIRDLGIDIDLPADQNWIQRIAGVNGFTIKYLFPGMNGLPEGFTFEGISFQEQIPSLWDLGTNFGAEENGEPVSWVLEEGESLIVSDGSKYYVFIVREINVRAMDNSDNYVLDIKY